MICTILIIGGGQAGAQAIDTLRREGFGGRLVLIGDEPELPYQRPPLSKKYLSGEMAADRLVFRHRSFYDEHRIELKLGARAVRLHPAARRVVLADGETLTYDRLLLGLGATSRLLTCPGAELPGVHYLRGLADVTPIQAGFKPGARVVIIGGGYIGLETAATCRKMGCAITVLEMADRVMNRVVAPCVSQYFAEEHRGQGVNILCDMRVVRLEGQGRVERVVCADGSSHAADLVIVGVGAVATTRLASDWPATTASSSTNTAAPAMRRSMPRAIAPIIQACASAGGCASNPWTMPSNKRRPRRSICSTGLPHTIVCLGSGPINSTISC
jgi:3-phenylpropionate/trans-cinnamate dioxygenase ferredoxin reductase subunit